MNPNAMSFAMPGETVTPVPAAVTTPVAEPVKETVVETPKEEVPEESTTTVVVKEEEEEGNEEEVKKTTAPKSQPRVKKEKEEKQTVLHDTREHLNIVFIGHVDAGKSTITGQILLLTGQVDERTMIKYEQEAKKKNRESWYLAYILDTSQEERERGKTVEVGRAQFASKTKRYTLLDAPGHKDYVPSMIGGTAQADVGVLVISARKGEFETGFDRGGQTREHAMLAKALGISHLIVLINKMDEKTVQWKKERYDDIIDRLSPFLKKWGYNVKKDVVFIPCSGYTGANIQQKVSSDVCSWYKGGALLDVLDSLPPVTRDLDGGVRFPVITRFKDMGALFILGKLESGTLRSTDKLLMMPVGEPVQIQGLLVEEEEVEMAQAGENVLMKVSKMEEDDVHEGYVLCSEVKPCRVSRDFIAQVIVLDLLPHKPILSAGYQCVLHVHTAVIECTIVSIISELDRKTGKNKTKKSAFLRTGSVANVRIQTELTAALDTYAEYPAMGRFTLRDEKLTIVVGKILKIKESKTQAEDA